MDIECNFKHSESVAVHEIIGEPAMIINGVPFLHSESTAPVQLHSEANASDNCDPCFGDWLEGREIRKLFGGQYYSGKIVKYDKEENWHRVTYEDGDFEDLEWHELEEVLVPLDISVPLTTLALQQCKTDGDTSLSRTTLARTRRGHSKSLGSEGKTLGLLQASETGRLEVEKLQEMDLNSGQNLELNL